MIAIKTNYKCVTTVAEIREYLKNARVVAFDYETAPNFRYRGVPKAALDPAKSHIVGCSFSVEEGTGIYVPIDHLEGENIDKEEFYAFLKEFLTDESIIKVAHNMQFEAMFSVAKNIIIQAPVYDTIAAAQLTLKSKYSFRNIHDSGLKKLAPEICKVDLPSFTEVTEGKHFDELDPQDYETIRYGAADSDFALRLYHIFNDWFDRFFPKHRWLVEHVESETAIYLGIMKYYGIPVDEKLFKEFKEKAVVTRAELKKKIDAITGNIPIGENASTAAFKKLIFNTYGIPVMKLTKKMKPSIDDEAMILMHEWCEVNMPDKAELFTLVQEYRKWGKIESTYLDGYMNHINSTTGRIHPDILSLDTDTGRMSCAKPNAQNMPRKDNDPVGIRNLIKAPDNEVIISLDFSQIELRVGAFYCRDEAMLNTYSNGGDIHAQTTSVIFGCSYEEAQDKHRAGYKEQRSIAKNCNFGTFYGLFPKGLQNTLRFKAGIKKTEEECAEIIGNLKRGYPGLTRWQEATKAEAARTLYSETWLGRRRYLPDITSKEWSKKSFAERCALNTPIQGTAADILKLAITRIIKGLPERPWLKPILQIHDELTFIIPEDKVDEAVAFIKVCMEENPFEEFDLPLVAEASVGKTFGTLEELEG